MSTILEKSLSQKPIAEGKTKMIYLVSDDSNKVVVLSKDDITAGDGLKHDVMQGKANWANQTTCNVFRLLAACGIPVAFDSQIGPVPSGTPESYGNSFIAPKCTMLPYEVVVRREAHGSYLKRAPHLTVGHIFPQLVFEFYLKTSGKKWKNHELICDDPYMIHDCNQELIHLYDPKQPNLAQAPSKSFLSLTEREVFSYPDEEKLIEQMGIIARQVFLILEKAWQLQGRKIVDFKVEFGIGPYGKLLLADVIDSDSWRVVDGAGNYMDKQVYRDGGSLDKVAAKYREAAALTSQFSIPNQRLIFWRGSNKDDLEPLYKPLLEMFPKPQFSILDVTCSVHKQPALAYKLLQQHLSEVPDSIIIAYIGMSNGAGPTLAANASVPVITVPAGYKNFKDDVWSSLRIPSNVPVMTVLDPANATLAALKILAMRNPSIYAALQFDQEKRMTNL